MKNENAFLIFPKWKFIFLLTIIVCISVAFIFPNLLEKPFKFENTGLPYHAPTCGTGMPTKLKTKDAKLVIEEAFEAENIVLKKNYPIKKDGIKIIADGYNEELKIGYIWMDWQNLEMGDAYITDMNNDFHKTNLKKQLSRNFKETYSNPENFITDLDKKTEGEWGNYMLNFKNRIEKIYSPNKPFSEKDSLIFKETYLEYFIISKLNGGFYPPNFVELGKEIIKIEDLEKKNEQVYRFIDLEPLVNRLRNEQAGSGAAIVEFAINQVNNVNQKDWESLLQVLNILKSYSQKRFGFKEISQKIAKSFELSDKDRNSEWAEILDMIDRKTINIKEVKGLDLYAEKMHQNFIAPISQYDSRFTYSKYERNAALKKLLSKEESSYKQLIIEQEYYTKIEDEKLADLKSAVTQYIQWAKAQQGY